MPETTYTFLDGLIQGAPGADGPPGADGAPGPPGPPGAVAVFGANLTDADQTITVVPGENRKQIVGSLTGNRIKTLAEPASDGETISIWRYDASGFTLTVRNGGYWGGDVLVIVGTKVTFTSGGGAWAVSGTESI